MDNFVVAHGYDQVGGVYRPLPVSGADIAAGLPKRYSIDNRYVQNDPSEFWALPGVADGADVFIHGVDLNLSEDSFGLYPLGQVTPAGFNDSTFLENNTLRVGSQSYNFLDGYIGCIMGFMRDPRFFVQQGATAEDTTLRLAGGYIETNVLIRGYENSPGSTVGFQYSGAAPEPMCYVQATIVYSVVGS